MKTKLLASSLLMASALMASGTASATLVWGWQGTQADWQANGPITDGPPAPALGTTLGIGDGDTTFTFMSSTFDPLITNITLKEEELNGVDLYNVGIGWLEAQITGSFSYEINTIDPSGFSLAGLDSVVSLVGDVTKFVYSDSAMTNLILTLHSVNGSHDPIVGLTAFSSYQDLFVKDVINSGNINDMHNEFSVPEPTTLSLLAMGLAVFGYNRRRKMFDSEGLVA